LSIATNFTSIATSIDSIATKQEVLRQKYVVKKGNNKVNSCGQAYTLPFPVFSHPHMKRFTGKLILFLSPFLLLGTCAELLVRHIPNDYKLKRNYLDSNSRNITTLILGSSHAYYGLDPAYMSPSTFNASSINQSLNFDLAILKRYDGRWSSLKYIVLPIDYTSFFVRLQNSAEQWRVKNYNIYYNISTYNSHIEDHSEVLSFKWGTTSYRLKHYYVQHKSDITSTPLGWGSDYPSSRKQDLATTAVLALKRHSENSKAANFDLNKADLVEILNYTQTHHIKVLLYTSPVTGNYSSLVNPVQMDTTLQTVGALPKQYNNVVYYNLLSDLSFESADFYDADHLNEVGARKLSRKIAGLLKIL